MPASAEQRPPIGGATHLVGVIGQHPGEDYKTYRTRLENEMANILADMITRRQATMPSEPSKPVETTPSVEQYVPQDTAPHPPLGH